MNIADQIVSQLVNARVEHVFAVGGANIEDLLGAVQRRQPAIRVMLTKHEHGAACAASAYARVRGGLGVVAATSGGGAMNLTHGLAEARAAHVPLLAIVGEPPSELQGFGAFQDTSGRGDAVDALAVLGAAAGFCRRVAHPDDALRLLDEALVHIAAASGPAVLLIAKDHQSAQVTGSGEREFMLRAPSFGVLPFVQTVEAVRRLVGRCVVIAGEEVLRSQAREELAQLIAALDARVAVAPDARDAFDNSSPRFLGVAGAMGEDRVLSALQNAQSCLIVGTRLPLLARMGLEASLNELPCVSVGREPPYLTRADHLHLACELRGGLRLLLAAARERDHAMSSPKPARIEQASISATGSVLDSPTALAFIQSAIAHDEIVLVDAGNTGASATHYLRAPRDGRWLIAMGMAGMGYTFGAALGAACASGKRCWVIAGDGAFYMHGMEIHTAVEHALPITYVIFDNRAHGMCLVRERLLLHANGGYNSFRRSQLAAGLGAMFPGLLSHDCATGLQLIAALEAARARLGPSVIVLQSELIEVPPFVALQRADPLAKTVSRGGEHAGE